MAITELDCVEVQEDPLVIDAGDVCVLEEGIVVTGRLEEVVTDTYRVGFQSFTFAETDLHGPGRTWTFEGDGEVWYMEVGATLQMGAQVRLRRDAEGYLEKWHDDVDLWLDAQFEENEDGVETGLATVEVFSAPDGDPTGAFCMEYEMSRPETCVTEADCR